DFGVCARHLSPSELDTLVRAFIGAHPPVSSIASEVPEKVAEFLARAEPWCMHPLLAHLARYDWERAVLTASAEEATLEEVDIEAFSPEETRDVTVRLPKRASVVEVAFPFHGVDVRSLPRDAQPAQASTGLLLQADGGAVRVFEITRRAYDAFRLLL